MIRDAEIAWPPGDLMIRYFLVMAVTGTSLLVADFVLGFFATAEPHGPTRSRGPFTCCSRW